MQAESRRSALAGELDSPARAQRPACKRVEEPLTVLALCLSPTLACTLHSTNAIESNYLRDEGHLSGLYDNSILDV